MSNKNDKRAVSKDQWFRLFMPYVFHQIDFDGRKHCYVPLNKDYKPLGVRSQEDVDLGNFIYSHGVFFASDPKRFKNIWVGRELYLYSGHPASMQDYGNRLARLMNRSMRLVPKPV